MMKKSIAAVLVLVFAFSFLASCKGTDSDQTQTKTAKRYTFYALDTDCTLTVYFDNDSFANTAADAVDAVNKTFPDGKNYVLAEKGETLSFDEETYALLKKGVEIGEFTDGAFDLAIAPLTRLWNIPDAKTPPDDAAIAAMLAYSGTSNMKFNDEDHTVTFGTFGGIDIGGIAKGFAGNSAVATLKNAGCYAGVLSLGGNVVVWGEKPDGTDYTVAVKSPLSSAQSSEYLGNIKCKDVCVVTSGTYERYFEYEGKRYHHIIDPTTGYPADTDVLSATVIAEDGTYADALATAFVVLGYEKSVSYILSAIEKDYIKGAVLVSSRCRVSVYGDINFELTSGDFVKDE